MGGYNAAGQPDPNGGYNADGTPVGSGANIFGNTNQGSVAGTPSAVGYNTGLPGQVGSIGGEGKTGGAFGIGNENVQQQLAASGYSPYKATAAPWASVNSAPEQQFRAGEVGLMGQLQTAAAGQGTSAAQSTLRGATDQSIASQMALAASRRGTPGTMAGVQTAGTLADQDAANQAATLRAGEIANAQSSLAGVAASGAGQDINMQNLGLNATAQNIGSSNFMNTLNASQQGALNAIIGSAVGGANAGQQALLPQAIGAATGGISGLASAGASAMNTGPAPAAHGTVATHPQFRLIGEAGPEAVVPIDHEGRPDMARATDPKLQWILEHHGYDWKGSKEAGMPHELPHQGTVAGNGNADHALLAQIVGLRQDIQRMAGRRA